MFDLMRRMATVIKAHHPLWNLEPNTVVCTCGEWKGNIDDGSGGRVVAEYHRYHKVFGDKIPDADSLVVWQATITTDWFKKETP